MDQIKIGQYIANKRKAHSLTQEQLAEKLGRSRKIVYQSGSVVYACLPSEPSARQQSASRNKCRYRCEEEINYIKAIR